MFFTIKTITIFRENIFYNLYVSLSMHKYLRAELELPDYYGENLDALYDCLTEVCEPVILKIPQAVAAGSELGWYGARLLTVVQDAAAANPNLQVELI